MINLTLIQAQQMQLACHLLQLLLVSNGSFHEEFNPKATLEYIGDDSLTWLTYAAGFKAGSVGFANFSANAANTPAAMEELEMIELGYKATIQDGRSR